MLARNLTLLQLIAQGAADEDVLAVWANHCLTTHQRDVLLDALKALESKSSHPPWISHDASLQGVFTEWMTAQEVFSADELLRKRQPGLDISTSEELSCTAAAAGGKLSARARREIASYIKTGSLPDLAACQGSEDARACVNPTLLLAPGLQPLSRSRGLFGVSKGVSKGVFRGFERGLRGFERESARTSLSFGAWHRVIPESWVRSFCVRRPARQAFSQNANWPPPPHLSDSLAVASRGTESLCDLLPPRYTVYFSTSIFRAVPLAGTATSAVEGLLDTLKPQFESFRQAVEEHRVFVRTEAGDVLGVMQSYASKQQFDFIDTSNVADYVSMAAILHASSRVLKPQGYTRVVAESVINGCIVPADPPTSYLGKSVPPGLLKSITGLEFDRAECLVTSVRTSWKLSEPMPSAPGRLLLDLASAVTASRATDVRLQARVMICAHPAIATLMNMIRCTQDERFLGLLVKLEAAPEHDWEAEVWASQEKELSLLSFDADVELRLIPYKSNEPPSLGPVPFATCLPGPCAPGRADRDDDELGRGDGSCLLSDVPSQSCPNQAVVCNACLYSSHRHHHSGSESAAWNDELQSGC